jgi:hypothetical protein
MTTMTFTVTSRVTPNDLQTFPVIRKEAGAEDEDEYR